MDGVDGAAPVTGGVGVGAGAGAAAEAEGAPNVRLLIDAAAPKKIACRRSGDVAGVLLV